MREAAKKMADVIRRYVNHEPVEMLCFAEALAEYDVAVKEYELVDLETFQREVGKDDFRCIHTTSSEFADMVGEKSWFRFERYGCVWGGVVLGITEIRSTDYFRFTIRTSIENEYIFERVTK